jgi:hypothetical protein
MVAQAQDYDIVNCTLPCRANRLGANGKGVATRLVLEARYCSLVVRLWVSVISVSGRRTPRHMLEIAIEIPFQP